jgi:hypothetical protein
MEEEAELFPSLNSWKKIIAREIVVECKTSRGDVLVIFFVIQKAAVL